MKLINYLLDPESTALTWLWGSMLIHIVLGLLFTSPIFGILYLFHLSIIVAVTAYYVWLFFRLVSEWKEETQKKENEL
jgi:hypothetical protein|tara:strand:- start:5491 stop:5724 length:234 start_codon:yes stop_codon:yes gene_type:complete